MLYIMINLFCLDKFLENTIYYCNTMVCHVLCYFFLWIEMDPSNIQKCHKNFQISHPFCIGEIVTPFSECLIITTYIVISVRGWNVVTVENEKYLKMLICLFWTSLKKKIAIYINIYIFDENFNYLYLIFVSSSEEMFWLGKYSLRSWKRFVLEDLQGDEEVKATFAKTGMITFKCL